MDPTQQRGIGKLPTEIRLLIWRMCYEDQPPRLVELRTNEHPNCDDHEAWCPRHSPSPAPTVVNICREARDEARKMAREAGHLLRTFVDPLHPSVDIYFNFEKDTLFVANEKEHWIRDWGLKGGILTQLESEHVSRQLLSLAIGLDPVNRSTSQMTLRQDVEAFPALQCITFVAPLVAGRVADDMLTCFRSLAFTLKVDKGYRERDALRAQLGPLPLRGRTYPIECNLAIRRAGQLEFEERHSY